MSVRRLKNLIERAERRAAEIPADGYMQSLGYIEVAGIWYGPDSYLAGWMDEVIVLTREIHHADKQGDVQRIQELTKQLTEIQRKAITQLVSSDENERPSSQRSRDRWLLRLVA